MSQLRYFMYLRKSNESDEKQELSIPAQEDALKALATKKGLQIVGEPMRESHSAKLPGRPLFTEMMAGLREKKADGIICWHLDRLSRNPFDEASIKCGLVDGTISEVVTPDRTFKNTPDDGLLSSIMFAMATKYSQDLSINIKRGNKAALERGLWPGKPKLGYMRDAETKRLIPDPERFDLVREMWRLRLGGTPVSEVCRTAREEWGLTTTKTGKCGGKLISLAAIWKIFSDPFYTGLMIRREGIFEGLHSPMISTAEFEHVQSLVKKYGARNGPRYRKNPFAYRGLITCGECGALVTAEYTTNRYGKRYTYWHCCRKSRRYKFCPERSIEGSKLNAQLEVFMGSLRISNELTMFLNEELKILEGTHHQATAKAAKAHEKELSLIKTKLERLRELCVDGVISTDELRADRKKLLMRKQQLGESGGSQPTPELLIEPLREAISFANLAQSQFKEADENRKRQIVKSVASNLFLKDKSLLITAKEPYASYMRMDQNPDLCTWRDGIGTLVSRQAVVVTPNVCHEISSVL